MSALDRAAALRGRDAEEGFTLVELLVYAMLLGIVLVMVGSMLISGLRTQGVVIDATSGTKTGQLVSQSVGQGIRNASGFAVAANGSDQWLRARVAIAEINPVSKATTVTWRCEAWYYVAAEKAIYSANSTASIPLPATTAPMPSGWLQLATGISVPTGSAGPFSGSPPALTLAFSIDAGQVPDVQISTVYNVRLQQHSTASGPTTCF